MKVKDLNLKETWFTQLYQHGRVDRTFSGECFGTKNEAVRCAKWMIGGGHEVGPYLPYTQECIIFKAVTVLRPKKDGGGIITYELEDEE